MCPLFLAGASRRVQREACTVIIWVGGTCEEKRTKLHLVFLSGSGNREKSSVSRSGCLSGKAGSGLCQPCPFSFSFSLCSKSPFQPSLGCLSSLFPGLLNPSLSLSSGDPQPFVPAFFVTTCSPVCYSLTWELFEG